MTHGDGYLLIHADAGAGIPLKDNSIDACVCSPPFFGLRKYQGVDPTPWPAVRSAPMPGLAPVTVPAMTSTLGNESDPTSFVAHLVHVFRDVRRVLSSEGVAVVNMGDSYVNNLGNGRGGEGANLDRQGGTPHRSASDKTGFGIPERNLLGIPWRLAFALQADGWLLRSAPPWIKPDNAMPESVQSRPGTAHEMIFILAKSDRYYWDADSVRRPMAPASAGRYAYRFGGSKNEALVEADRDGMGVRTRVIGHREVTDGRNLRTSDIFMDALDEAIAWHRGRADELQAARDRGGMIVGGGGEAEAVLANPQSFKGAHFATWSGRLITPFIRAATSEHGCCSACGRGLRRVVERDSVRPVDYEGKNLTQDVQHSARRMLANVRARRMAGEPHDDPFPAPVTLGWSPACSCSAPARPAVVLDPFAGSGSTLVAALALGRSAIGIDASAEYLGMARRRLERPHAAVSAPAAKSAAPLPLFPEDAP